MAWGRSLILQVGNARRVHDENVQQDNPPNDAAAADIMNSRNVPCMDGARGARGESVISAKRRVQPCIRPMNAAAVAAGPDVIR